MTGDELWAEAQTLARAAVRLASIPNGSPPVGCFRGPPLPGVALAGRHVLSFDCSALPPALARVVGAGTLTLHADPEDCDQTSGCELLPGPVDFAARPAAHESVTLHAHLARGEDDGARYWWDDLEHLSVPLYAHAEVSLPPVGDLLASGSAAILAWLHAIGWDPAARYNRNFDARSTAAAEYEKRWWKQYRGKAERPKPLWWLPSGRTFAVLGGWPVLMFDDPPPAAEFVCTVFAEEEPRRHVFPVAGGGLQWLDESS
jgi:hypothetical protein